MWPAAELYGACDRSNIICFKRIFQFYTSISLILRIQEVVRALGTHHACMHII